MKTGIVFQINGRKAILLKPDGSFVSVPARSDWQVGETVPISQPIKTRRTSFLAAAACLALVVLGGFGLNRFYASPVALISLDVNPSIELSVNRLNRITAFTALNDEGTEILAEANIKNERYQDALVELLQAESTGGYLKPEANVVLTVFSSDSAVQSSLLSELRGVVDSSIALYSDQITAEYHAVDESTVNGAHGHGVTAGKYLYLQELQALAPDTDISKLSHHSIEQLKGEIETCKQEHAEEGGTAGHDDRHEQEETCDPS